MTVKTDELVALNKIYKIEFECCLYYTTLSYYLQYDLRIIIKIYNLRIPCGTSILYFVNKKKCSVSLVCGSSAISLLYLGSLFVNTVLYHADW